jgi:hypothetical protein
MNEMDYDYNTGRKRMVLPEYGRHVQKMIDHILTIEDREERNKAARTIIGIMGSLNPQLRDVGDFKHKLWDHLAVISNFGLDVDTPFEKPEPSKFSEKPNTIDYNQNRIRYKHYGRSMELMIRATAALEPGEEKENLIKLLANHMKKLYLTWNREMVDDLQILSDLKELSQGKIDLSPEVLKLSETKDILSKNQRVFKKKPGRK